MKKILSLTLILTSSLLLSACSNNNISNTDNSKQDSSASVVSKEFSIKELLLKNVSQKCTWESTIDGTFSSGEMLIKGNKFKQSVVIKNEEGEMKTNSISDGEYVYSWSDSSQGSFAMKVKMDAGESSQDSGEIENNQIDIDQKYQFNCNDAILTDSDFKLPQGIEFTDYSEVLNQVKNYQ